MKKRKIIWDAIRGVEHDYTSGSLNVALVSLAIPMMLEMIMESLFAIVDIFWVTKISTEAVATVGLTESVLMIVQSLGLGIMMAVTAMIARRVGEGNIDATGKVATNAVLLTVVLSGFMGLFFFFNGDQVLRWMGASETTVAEGSGYTSILLGFNVVLMLLFVLNGIFRGAGNAAIAMRTLWLANGLNIILDPIFIFGWWLIPEMGVEGAAIASCTGRGVGVLYQLYHLLGGKSLVKVRAADWKIDFQLIRKILDVAKGGAGQFLIATASWIFIVTILAKFGDAAVAGYTIGIRIIIFTILPSWGLSNAVATLVGQNLGADQPDRAEETVWVAGKYNMLFMLAVSVVFYIGADMLVGFFTSDPISSSYAVTTLRVLCVGYVFFSYAMVLSQAFNGAGNTSVPTWLNFIFLWLVQIPLAYGLAVWMDMGPSGVFWGIVIAESLMACAAIILFRKGNWKYTEV